MIASFAEAVATGAVETWAQSYSSGECPAPIQQGAQELAALYDAMGELPAEAAPVQAEAPALAPIGEVTIPVPFEGEAPVFQFTENDGSLNSISASDIFIANELMNDIGLDDYFAVRDPLTGTFTFFPVKEFRHSFFEDGTRVVTLSDGQELRGTLPVSLRSDNPSEPQSVDLRFSEVSLVSLPAYMETWDYTNIPGSRDTVWQLHIGEPIDQVYTIMNPVFLYRYPLSNCISIGGPGGCIDPTSSSDFRITVNEQRMDTTFDDFTELLFTFGAEISTVQFVGVRGDGGEGVFEHVPRYSDSRHIMGAIPNTPYFIAVDRSGYSLMTLERIRD